MKPQEIPTREDIEDVADDADELWQEFLDDRSHEEMWYDNLHPLDTDEEDEDLI